MKTIALTILTSILLSSCASIQGGPVIPPKAKKQPKKLSMHGDIRVDPYFWMNQRENPEVRKYLEEENEYSKKQLAVTSDLTKTLFDEMKSREKKEDSSVPYFTNGYYYYTRYDKQSEYPIVARKKENLESKEEVILDANALAKGKSFFQLGSWSVSPNGNLLAYSIDTIGRRFFTIYLKNLETGETLSKRIEKVTGNLTWAEDNATLFYSKQHPETLRHQWIYRLNVHQGKPVLVYHEKDDKFHAGVGKSRTRKYIIISVGSTESSEYYLIDAHKPTEQPRLFSKRRPKHEYSIDHADNFFFVLSNNNAKNFKVLRTPDEKQTDQSHWKTFINHRSSTYLESIDVFIDHLVLETRTNGVTELEIFNRRSGKRDTMTQPEKSHMVGVSMNPNYNTSKLRYYYSSMTTPMSIFDYDFKTKKKVLLKEEEVLGGFNKDNYVSQRIWAKTKNGVRIPISLVYRKGFTRNGQSPLLLYGYGSYGYSIDPNFSSSRLSLLDRGFVFAIAHIRGSSTMGRQWYLDGKYLKKKNTFTDFIACAEHLIANKYTRKGHIYAMGGSAGGLLMGAVINMRPDLFHGVIAQVPFVDVVTTMLDDTLPLTTLEYEEWGNPNKKVYYNYMKSYSPYDNIKSQAYPHLFVRSGFHDSQVQYWEPTKWVAKLRDYNTSKNPILLDTNMEAGHGGKSGRFKSLEERAQEYAYLLNLEKNNETNEL